MTEQARAKVKTWTIRFLFFIIFVIAIGLLMLSTIAGTSETHRKGLEQGFSDFLNADVRLGRLEKFNIVPQLDMRTGDIKGRFRNSGDEFMIDRLNIAFGFFDLAFGRKKIENFDMENFRFASDAKTDLRIDHARIVDKPASSMEIKGQYQRKNFDLTIPLEKTGSMRPAYYFAGDARFSGHFGSLNLQGNFARPKKTAKQLGHLEIKSENKVLMTGGLERQRGGQYKLMLVCANSERISGEAEQDISILKEVEFIDMQGSCL